MLISRYWLIIPVLAIAGSFAAKKTVPAGPGHAADAHAALRRADHRHRARWSARSPSCRRSRSGRSSSTSRCSALPSEGTDMTRKPLIRRRQAAPMRSMFERSFVMPAVWESFRRLAPQDQWRNPVMFVCYIGAILTTRLFVAGAVRPGRSAGRLHRRRIGVALDHGAVRQLRRGDGRGPRQGAGGERCAPRARTSRRRS